MRVMYKTGTLTDNFYIYSMLEGFVLFRRLIRKLRKSDEDMSPEYGPWLRDLVPLTQEMMKAFDKKRFNKDENHEARILLALFFLGVVEYYQKAKVLSCGQHRYLGIEVLVYLGFNYEMASHVFDRRGDLSHFFPEIASDGTDALDAGFRCGREYLEHGDQRVFVMPKVKELQWAKNGWLKP